MMHLYFVDLYLISGLYLGTANTFTKLMPRPKKWYESMHLDVTKTFVKKNNKMKISIKFSLLILNFENDKKSLISV